MTTICVCIAMAKNDATTIMMAVTIVAGTKQTIQQQQQMPKYRDRPHGLTKTIMCVWNECECVRVDNIQK